MTAHARDRRGNRRRPDLRHGYTTGACATAAAAAATRTLVGERAVRQVTIDLPGERGVTFQMTRCERSAGRVTCGTIKDAGDDPDVTDGAEIQATVEWADEPGVTLLGGEGVGVVTKPGLPVEIGQPAINPVPLRLITEAVTAEADEYLSDSGREAGLKVTITVPGGEAIAQETLNPRLGIVGGISILGTTGIVKPFSRAAYRASIYFELNVAAEDGLRHAVLTTGSRSEEYAMAHHADWPALGFVQVGDHMGYALRKARRLGFPMVVVVGMVGKLSKLAQGRMQTHVSEGGVDFDFLTELVEQLGVDEPLLARIGQANTARHVQMLLREAGVAGLEERLAQLAAERACAWVDGAFDVEVLLFDIGGDLLAIGTKEGTR